MSDTATTRPAMRVTNPVLQAMAKVDDILAPLSDLHKTLVLAWAVTNHSPQGAKISFESDPKPTEE